MRVYLDHNASSPMSAAVADATAAAWRTLGGNPSSPHAAGRAARLAVDRARDAVAALLHASPREVTFTSGGTEAVQLAILGALRGAPAGARHVVTSTVEHAATREALAAAVACGGTVTELPVDGEGRLSPEAVAAALRPDTALVTLLGANNETGVCFPVEAIGALCRARGVWFHCDAVQLAGRVPLDVTTWAVDLVSVAAHKLGGPRGAGALWVRRGVVVPPLAGAGSQEGGRRPGTEPVAALVGFGVAARVAAERAPAYAARVGALRDRLERTLAERVGGVRVSGAGAERIANTASVAFDGCDGEELLGRLDAAGVAVSTGAACSQGSGAPSHVLRAMGRSAAQASSTLRFSLGWETTAAEVDAAIEATGAAVAAARAEP